MVPSGPCQPQLFCDSSPNYPQTWSFLSVGDTRNLNFILRRKKKCFEMESNSKSGVDGGLAVVEYESNN